MAFELMALPYPIVALEPVVSSNTVTFHHGKHHAGYVQKLNDLIKGTKFESSTLEQIMTSTYQNSEFTAIFNNAAQVWNHNFYWNSVGPNGGGAPKEGTKIAQLLNSKFGNFEAFTTEFVNKGVAVFGSGWIWLVLNSSNQLEIMTTSNADAPLLHGSKALFTIDVWEHSYYLDYQNKRIDYLKASLKNLVNWDFAEKNLLTYIGENK